MLLLLTHYSLLPNSIAAVLCGGGGGGVRMHPAGNWDGFLAISSDSLAFQLSFFFFFSFPGRCKLVFFFFFFSSRFAHAGPAKRDIRSPL